MNTRSQLESTTVKPARIIAGLIAVGVYMDNELNMRDPIAKVASK